MGQIGFRFIKCFIKIKVINVILALLICLNNISIYDSYALDRVDQFSQDKLAVSSQLSEEEFKRRVHARLTCVSHEAVNHYIREKIGIDKGLFPDDWAAQFTDTRDINDTAIRGKFKDEIDSFKHVTFVSIEGLLRNTGQLAHVGLRGTHEDYEDTAVVYIDSKYFNDPDMTVQKHEVDEIVQWELLRKALGIDREEIRDWIKTNLTVDKADSRLESTPYQGCSSLTLAERFHEGSYDLRPVYAELDIDRDTDYGYISRLYERFPESQYPDINIAAKRDEMSKIASRKTVEDGDAGDIKNTTGFVVISKNGAGQVYSGNEKEIPKIIIRKFNLPDAHTYFKPTIDRKCNGITVTFYEKQPGGVGRHKWAYRKEDIEDVGQACGLTVKKGMKDITGYIIVSHGGAGTVYIETSMNIPRTIEETFSLPNAKKHPKPTFDGKAGRITVTFYKKLMGTHTRWGFLEKDKYKVGEACRLTVQHGDLTDMKDTTGFIVVYPQGAGQVYIGDERDVPKIIEATFRLPNAKKHPKPTFDGVSENGVTVTFHRKKLGKTHFKWAYRDRDEDKKKVGTECKLTLQHSDVADMRYTTGFVVLSQSGAGHVYLGEAETIPKIIQRAFDLPRNVRTHPVSTIEKECNGIKVTFFKKQPGVGGGRYKWAFREGDKEKVGQACGLILATEGGRRGRRRKTDFEKAVALFEKYHLLDLAASLSSNPEEMQQAIATLLASQGVDMKAGEFERLSRAFILNLREGAHPGAGEITPGNPLDYLRALIALHDEIQALQEHEQFIFLRAFVRLAFTKFASNFKGAMQEMREVIEKHGGSDFLDSLVEYTEDMLGKGLKFQPEHLRTRLKPHQRLGAWFMKQSDRMRSEGIHGFLLEDDTRLGKTIQTYAAMDPDWKACFVVPATTMDTWAEQYYQHTKQKTRLVAVRGDPLKKRALIRDNRGKKGVILLYSIEDLRMQSDDALADISQGLDLLVVDEGQRVENYGGQELKTSSLQAKVIHKLGAERSWVLSASPYTSHPRQLFSIFNLIHTNPETGEVTNPLYASRREFNRLLAGSLKQMRWLYALKARIGLRRTKKELGLMYSAKDEIPPEKEGAYTLTEEQSDLTLRVIKNLGEYLERYNKRALPGDRYPEESIGVFLKLQFLDWAATDPSMLGEDMPTAYWDAMHRIVVPRLKAGKKGIIFGQNTSIIDKIVEQYERRGIGVARIDGTVSGIARDKNRKPIRVKFLKNGKMVVSNTGETISAQAYQRHLFQQDPNVRLIVMNEQAGLGLDLSAADWVLHAQLPRNYVEYYQSSDRAIGFNPYVNQGKQKKVEVLCMVPKYSAEFIEKISKTQDRLCVEHGTPGELLYNGMMGEDRARFDLVMEGIPPEKRISEEQALSRLVHSIYGFLEDPSMNKRKRKQKKEMTVASAFYGLYQRAKGDKEKEDDILMLVDGYTRTDVSPAEFVQSVVSQKSFDLRDIRWIIALFRMSNKQQRDHMLRMLPAILSNVWKSRLGVTELIERGPPVFKNLGELLPELIIPLIAQTQAWETIPDNEEGLELGHIGATVITSILEDIITGGFSDYDRKQWAKRFVCALIPLIDFKNQLFLDFLAYYREGILDDSLSVDERIEFFGKLATLKNANPRMFEKIIAMRKTYAAVGAAVSETMRMTFVDLFGLPDTRQTQGRLLDLARQWGNLNAPVQLMSRLNAGVGEEYTEHAALFGQTMRHIVDGTYRQWRNEQSIDPTGHEIEYNRNIRAGWAAFNREELVRLGNVNVGVRALKALEKRKMNELTTVLENRYLMVEMFGELGNSIHGDIADLDNAISKLKAEIREKGKQRHALEVEGEKGESAVDKAILILNQALSQLKMRLNFLNLYKALQGGDVSGVIKLLNSVEKNVTAMSDDGLVGTKLLKLIRELKPSLVSKGKPIQFRNVEVQITCDPDLIMRRGMLNEEMKNCFHLAAGVKQIACLVDDLASRNKMLAIVRVDGREAAVAMVKVKKTEDGAPVIMIERPLYRWGYNFEKEIAKAIEMSKLPDMRNTAIAGDWYKTSDKNKKPVTLYTTGARGPDEYHETLWGPRPRKANVHYIARIIVEASQEPKHRAVASELEEKGITRVKVKAAQGQKEAVGIGHGNRKEDEFIDLLKQTGTKCLVDVRSSPRSRYNPHFNQKRLRATLEANGISYVWLGDMLGGRLPAYGDDFEKYMKADPDGRFSQGIEKLLEIIKKTDGRVGICCSETKPENCHRKFILQYLAGSYQRQLGLFAEEGGDNKAAMSTGRANGSAGAFVDTLLDDEALLDKARSEEGITVKEIAPLRKYTRKSDNVEVEYREGTVSKELRILRELGIFKKASGYTRDNPRYALTDRVKGEDIRDTRRRLRMAKSIGYRMNGKEMDLYKGDIPRDDTREKNERAFVEELIRTDMDIRNAEDLFDKVIGDGSDADRYYLIKYDEDRIRSYAGKVTMGDEGASPEEVVNLYVKLLRRRLGKEDKVVLKPFSGKRKKDKSLLSVQCYSDVSMTEDTLIGQGSVDMKGNLAGQAIRVVGMINMAVAASTIPQNVDSLDAYQNEIDFIKRQYKELTGQEFEQDIRFINLPPAEKIPLDEVSEYYRVMLQRLGESA